MVAAAQAALDNASALPADDSLHGSVMAVVDQLASVEMSRTVYSQQGMVDEALTAAETLVEGLSDTSSADEVAAAEAAVAAAQAALEAATALPADDPWHASVMDVGDDLGDAMTSRTASMETQAIEALIATAQSAVGGLNQVTSPGMAVSDARDAVAAVEAAIAGATALTQAQKDALSEMISASNTSLTGIEEFRATASGQLDVAQAALTHAQGLVDALTPSSTAAQAAEAYGALGAAQAAIHGATNLPANQIAALQKRVDDLTTEVGDQNTASSQRTAVTDALVAANAAIGALNDESTRCAGDSRGGLGDGGSERPERGHGSVADGEGRSESLGRYRRRFGRSLPNGGGCPARSGGRSGDYQSGGDQNGGHR